MSEVLNVGIVGLGVMGQRMLERIAAHPRLRATWLWDANPDTLAHTVALHPGTHAAAGAAQLIASPGLDSLYIATPPGAHMPLANMAFDAGLAVLCEKPLTVDFDAARRTVRRIADERQRAAVNFSLAASPGLALLQDTFGAASRQPLGRLHDVQIVVEFAAWPRPWQAAAGVWLSLREEGGFAREVLSHFVFVLQRVLGPATVWDRQVTYPADGRGAETALRASLRAGSVEVRISGQVDPSVLVAERNRMLWRAPGGVVELRDWYALSRRLQGQASEVLGSADELRARGQAAQLDHWVALIEGRKHVLPGFAEALAVQETIESILVAR